MAGGSTAAAGTATGIVITGAEVGFTAARITTGSEAGDSSMKALGAGRASMAVVGSTVAEKDSTVAVEATLAGIVNWPGFGI